LSYNRNCPAVNRENFGLLSRFERINWVFSSTSLFGSYTARVGSLENTIAENLINRPFPYAVRENLYNVSTVIAFFAKFLILLIYLVPDRDGTVIDTIP
jgi:hypothetical protein